MILKNHRKDCETLKRIPDFKKLIPGMQDFGQGSPEALVWDENWH